MKIYVNYTNILIDLVNTNLLDDFTKLNWELHTTDFIIAEIDEPNQLIKIQKLISDGLLKVIGFSSVEMMLLYEMEQNYNGLSLEDCSVLYYANKKDGILLSGDGKLRKKAQSEGIEVKGILFILDKLVSNSILSKQDAIFKIIELANINKRLPSFEIEKRIRHWQAK